MKLITIEKNNGDIIMQFYANIESIKEIKKFNNCTIADEDAFGVRIQQECGHIENVFKIK